MGVAFQLLHISYEYLLGLGYLHIGSRAAMYWTQGCYT